MPIRGNDRPGREFGVTEITSDESAVKVTQKSTDLGGESLPDHGNHTTQAPIVYGFRKTWYTITNLVTTREYFADITHLKTFYYDPDVVTPLNIAARDSDESVVSDILEHDFSDPKNKLWLVAY